MSKMGSHYSFGHLKHKLWPKEGSGVELPGVRQFYGLTKHIISNNVGGCKGMKAWYKPVEYRPLVLH